MTHTTNYNLNKFEAADRVTRDGFNDNADAIDAALKANADAASAAQSAAASALTTAQNAADAQLFVKLRTVTSDTTTEHWAADVSWIDWDSYEEVYILPQLYTPDNTKLTFRMLYDNYSESKYFGDGGSPRAYALSVPNICVTCDISRITMRRGGSYFRASQLAINHRGAYTYTSCGILMSDLAEGVPQTLDFFKTDSGKLIAAGSSLTFYAWCK